MSITFPGPAFGKRALAKSCLHLCLNDDSAQVLSHPKIHALFYGPDGFPQEVRSRNFCGEARLKKIS